MVKEYISKLQTENEGKIFRIEEEKKKLEKDLSSAQELKGSLVAEKQSDTSIFSPRAADLNSNDKIKELENTISQLQMQIDNVNLQKDDALKNREEFQLLLDELNDTEGKTENKTEDAGTSVSDEDNSSVSREFLQTLYKKIETSLSLLNGNKNRCRSELRSALNMIRQFEDQFDSQ